MMHGNIGGTFQGLACALMDGMAAHAQAVDDQRVSDWMAYWQRRAMRAEAQLAQARAALARREQELLELEELLDDA